MRIADIIKSEQCRELFNEVNSFVSMSLKEYNDSFSQEREYSSKDIFDFVWGTVDLSRAEMIVLDSPLLQRLRKIHHLGMADVLYCNATSTRFSHTIGVVEVAGRLSRIVSNELGNNWGAREYYEDVVRMAAIFHDTGHMIYSHVSEIFFSYNKKFPLYDMVTKALTFFCEKTSSNSSLHEMLSVMIVNADETKRLFKSIESYLNWTIHTDEDRQKFTEYISGLIIGIPIDRSILPYSQIINGVIDADKLDYLSRDSECTKVPIAVDIARIIQKTKVVSVDKISNSEIWNDSGRGKEPYKILGIKNSAKKVFYQLAYARSNMFESVYYHHKVLTAETMFRNVLEYYFQQVDKDSVSFTDILSWTDELFCGLGDCLPKVKGLDDCERYKVSLMLKRLRNRGLYKRVAAFSEDNLSAESVAGSKRFIRNVIQSSKELERKVFIEEIEKEYKEICELLGLKDNITGDFVFAFVKYDAMPSAPIENGEGCFIWSSALIKQETMEAGRKSKQEQFYLLSDCIKREYAFLAFEKSLYSEYGILISRDASVCLKTSYNNLQITRKRLFEKDYYKNCLDIIDDNLIMEIINEDDVNEIVEKYKTFQGMGGWRIDKRRVYKFFKQFFRFEYTYQEVILLIDGVIRLLKNGIYIDRDVFVNAMNHLSNSIETDERIAFVTVGNVRDSSSHFSYFLNDCMQKERFYLAQSLENVLADRNLGDVICFCDDGAYSGKQIVSIFQEYMGVDSRNRYTNEHHVDVLSEDYRRTLCGKKIRILFVVFNKDNMEFVKSELKKLGLKDVEVLFFKSLQEKMFEKDIFHSDEQRRITKEELRRIGEQLLRSEKENHEDWSDERIKKSALGYNDSQQVVISQSSVPTYTIVALWMKGEIAKKKWEGLFVRTDK